MMYDKLIEKHIGDCKDYSCLETQDCLGYEQCQECFEEDLLTKGVEIKFFEIVYNGIDNQYHCVEEGNPKGTSFGVGDSVEDAIYDAESLFNTNEETVEIIKVAH